MFIKTAILFLCLVSATFLTAEEVKNSIIPTMETFEFWENLPVKKYTDNQYLEILRALNRKQDRVRLVSYQIYFKEKDFQDWESRALRIVKLVLNAQPDIFSLQGIDTAELQSLLFFFKDVYQCYGDLGNHSREVNPIFVRKERFSVQHQEVHTLPGKKQLILVKLLDLRTKNSFAVFNTRLTFDQPDQREREVLAINEFIAPVLKQMPVILAGSFHTFAPRLDLDFLPFYDGNYIQRILAKSSLKNALKVALLGHLGPLTTSAISSSKEVSGLYLDHIYVSGGVDVLFHAVEPGTVERYQPSDHMPVVVDFILK